MVKLKKVATATPRRGGVIYSVKFLSEEQMFAKSQGIARSDFAPLVGKYILVEHYNSRSYICPENFSEYSGEFDCGSIRTDALSPCSCYKRLHSSIPYLCTNCGKHLADKNHNCDDVFCLVCGKKLNTKAEKAFHKCEDCVREDLRRVYPYHGRPNRSTPAFERPHLRDSYAHLGIELEVDHYEHFTSTQTAKLSDILNPDAFAPFAMMEHDGSIGGAEFITQPITLKGLGNIRERLDEFYTKAKDFGGIFGDNNGVHFHIDREYFGEAGSEERAKAVLMLAYMIYAHYDFWKHISHRDRDKFYYTQGKDECKKGIATTARAVAYSDHYDALNTGNANTLEVRFFGGYIQTADDLLASADIVNALARWAKTASLGQAEKATPAQIVRYINDPANVKKFVEFDTPNGFTTSDALKLKAEFIKKLEEKIGE